MTTMSEARQRARRSYELGRAKLALGYASLALPMTLLALSSPAEHWQIAMCGTALALLIAGLAFVGGAHGRAVLPGVLAALVPLAAPVVMRQLGHGCAGMQCCLNGECGVCLAVCLGAGLLAGGVVGAATLSESRAPRAVLGFALLVAVLGGSLGCVVAGSAGVAGLLSGALMVSTPLWVLRRG